MTPSRFWPALIVALLGGNACIVAVTIVASSRAPGGAISPEYGRPDTPTEQSLHQQTLDRALGWSVEAGIEPGTPRRFVVDLRDGSGRPILAAQVLARLQPSSKGGSESLLRLAPGSQPGRFAAPLPDELTPPARARIDVDAVGMHCTRDLALSAVRGGRE